MGLRFFADQCVPNAVVDALDDAGHQVWRVRDYIPVESPDSVVISKAQELNAILISLNGDFADIVTYPPANYKGIVALQVRNHPEVLPQMLSRLKDYLSTHPDMTHYVGQLLLVEAHRIRIRK